MHKSGWSVAAVIGGTVLVTFVVVVQTKRLLDAAVPIGPWILVVLTGYTGLALVGWWAVDRERSRAPRN